MSTERRHTDNRKQGKEFVLYQHHQQQRSLI